MVEARRRACEVDRSASGVTGRADRIDIRSDGAADIIDYKTGASPSAKVARTLLDPQLALEAAVLKGGGFQDDGALETAGPASMCGSGLADRFTVDTVNNDNSRKTTRARPSANDLAEEARWSQLTQT